MSESTAENRAPKAAEDSPQATDVSYRALFSLIGDAIFVANAESGMIIDANPAAEELVGRPRAEILKLHHSQLHPSDQAEEARREFARFVQQPGAFRNPNRIGEWSVVHQDGRRIAVDILSNLCVDPDGTALVFGIFRNISDSRHTPDAWRGSEERFRQIAEIPGEFIWEVDTEGLYTYASPVVEQILGFKPEELVGKKHFHDFFVPERREEMKRAAFAVIGRRERFHIFPNLNVRKDGAIVALEATGMPIYDPSGACVGYRGADRDVTERHRAEESLRESERRFRALFENSLDAVLLTHTDGSVEAANAAACAMFGMTEQEICSAGRDALVVHGERLRAALETRRSRGHVQTELTHVRKDGTRFESDFSSAVLGDDKRAFVIIRDITDRKATQEALRESEQRFRSLFENATVGIYRTTPAGRIDMANPALVRMLGYESSADLSQRNLEESGFEPQYIRSDFRKILEQQGEIHGLEAFWTRRDGSILFVQESARCVRDETGAVRCYEGFIVDITDRKQAEAALGESEERFRNMADMAPVMIWVAGPDNLGTFFNKAWLDFTGRTVEQELGEGWIGGVHPDDLDHCLTVCGTSFNARHPFQIEFRLRRADGEYRWILDTGVPRYRHGEFIGFIGSCLDLTERKLIEERLRAREAQLTAAQRLAKVGSLEVDIKSGKVYWSAEMFRILGLPYDAQPEFSSFLNRVHPKDREIVQEVWDRTASSTAPVQAEFRIIRPQGDVRFVSSVVEAIKDELGATVGLRGATQDITEQVNATERLRESEKHLSNAERIAHVGNWRWDIESNLVYWSEELCRILGRIGGGPYSYEASLQLVVPGDRERVAQWVKDRLAGKGEISVEFQIGRPDGELRTVASVIEVTLDNRGLPTQAAGTCQDVTDARRAQTESFARQKLEGLGTLASGIAHDFNNLLGGVLAQAELAELKLAAGTDPQEELNEIRLAAVRGSEIVRQLLIYAGKESDVLEPVDLSGTAREMIGLLNASVSKHATLVTDLHDNLPAVKARSAQIRQILMNLVLNASDAIKNRDGVIRVATRRVTVDRNIAATLGEELAEGDYVQLEVSDTGSGMSQATLARIFDPFFSTKSAAGRGLGLAVIHGIARSLGGAICVSSELGKGTNFQILLPSAGTPARGVSDKPEGIEETLRPSPKGTVLVVEDEASIRLAVGTVLVKAGFTVFEACDGSEAIELIRVKGVEIDLLFLDVTLPGRPSHEVLAAAVLNRPDVKVILTSGYSEEMVRGTPVASQVREFVRKPFQLNTVLLAVQNALSS